MRKKFLPLSLVAAVVMFFAPSHAEFVAVAENSEPLGEILLQAETSANWWQTDTLTATGYGLAPTNADVREAKSLAKRAAMADAYRKLSAQASQIRVTAEKNIVRYKVAAVIRNAKVVSENFDASGAYTVVLEVPIYGVTNSIAKAAFTPVPKENFPPPSQNRAAQGNYTGLIIDCGDSELNPVLSPEIRAENKAIYRYENLDYEKVIARGMISYVEKNSVILTSAGGKKIFTQVGSRILFAATNSRAGNNPLVIKAKVLSDDGSCPVISDEDADKILAENQISHFLDDGAVVFTSNRIRGMRM